MKKPFIAFFALLSGIALLGAGCSLFGQSSTETTPAVAPTIEESASMDSSENTTSEPEAMMEEVTNEETDTSSTNEEATDSETTTEEPVANESETVTDTSVTEITEEAVEPEPEQPAQINYTGNVLSGGLSPVIEFNQSDYDKAVAANKVIVLTYYANWCPTCRKQEPEHFAGLSSLNNPNVVAFRVNFRDSDTSDAEENIARTYGVSSQDTKVIVANGQRVVKTLNFWSSADYVSQINAHL